jgi:hypothetical protein
MKQAIIISISLMFIVLDCGQVGITQAAANQCINIYSQTVADNYTVEDTVRYQINGKLYGLNFRPSDSITVIKSFHWQNEYGLYREYEFIVHNRYSNAHRYFETSHLDTVYNSYMTGEYWHDEYERAIRQLDTIQSKHIDFTIKYFNGYWIYLKEHNGNYYLNDEWSWHSSFYIADSVFTTHYMDGLYPKKILEAVSLQENGISILLNDDKESLKIEVFDKSKSIYRLFEGGRFYFIAPTRAIHNFEIIQYTNNTGDLI